MKASILIIISILALTMSACKTTQISQDDLEKAKTFALCSQQCYKDVYGTTNPALPTE